MTTTQTESSPTATPSAPSATTPSDHLVTRDAEAFAEHVFTASTAALEIIGLHLGDRLGWYRALADAPATPDELAGRTGTDPRYAREWLEYQASLGWLHAEPEGDTHRFTLPSGGVEVLTDPESLSYLAPLGRMVAGCAIQLPALLEAYRSGGGVGWETFGADARESQADMNRPWFLHALPDAFAGLPDLHAVLGAPDARVVEVGFGGGWSSIALARAYPQLHIDGYDIDEASVELARRNVAEAGLSDRVRFHVADAAALAAGEPARYDAALAFECLHDMPYPVEVLAAVRHVVRPGAPVVVMDEATADTFTAPGDEVERLLYGLSVALCLPDSMSHPGSAATGTVMRPDVLRDYARRAGFGDVEVLPIRDFGFWRFYRLT